MIEPGSKLAHYEVVSALGKGGMGEVWRAKDTKLGREVAIKTLPAEFAQDADRLARFEREAKLLASLNHPNIASIFGFEEDHGTHFLVMELVEGDTLADRIARGAIPVEESLKLALQIADALKAAHEKGVIHRDLKPANVKVTDDNAIKVLDFGLAKAFAGEEAEHSPSNSPTLSMQATQQGVILGTAAYMSPEQAKGRSVDRRADVFAFGCVLYEMLTGRQSFGKSDVSESLSAVISLQPDWDALPANLHPRLREAVERCLEKRVAERFQDIGDVKVDIENVLGDPSGVIVQPGTDRAHAAAPSRLSWALIGASAIVLATGAALSGWLLRPPPLQLTTWLSVSPGSLSQNGQNLALSPDGRTIVYAGADQLYVRNLGEAASSPIPGTEGASSPFFSPDGDWVGFTGSFETTRFRLYRVSLDGGPAVPVGGEFVRGASWGPDETIVFGTNTGGVFRVGVGGGEPEAITTSRPGEGAHQFPDVLPGGRAALLSVWRGSIENSEVALLDLDTGDYQALFGGISPRYVEATGHIVFGRENSLWAVRFDADRLEVPDGETARFLLGDVDTLTGNSAQFAIEGSTLVFTPDRGGLAGDRRLVWLDRDGAVADTGIIPGRYETPRLSPDDQNVLLWEDGDLGIYNLNSGRRDPVTTDGSGDDDAEWNSDGTQIAYSSDQDGDSDVDVFVVPADLSQPATQITFLDGHVEVDGWYGDLLAVHHHSETLPDILMLRMNEADPQPEEFVVTEAMEEAITFSPDGRFVAYVSDKTSLRAIYTRPSTGSGAERTASDPSGEAGQPAWGDGFLYYRSGGSRSIMSVPVSTDPDLEFGIAEELFPDTYFEQTSMKRQYDVTADGQRLLMLASVGALDPADDVAVRIDVVQNFLRELSD